MADNPQTTQCPTINGLKDVRLFSDDRDHKAIDAAMSEIERLRAEIADLKVSVIAFCAPYAVEYAKGYSLPPGHLVPTHYDILKNAGARMDSFIRANMP